MKKISLVLGLAIMAMAVISCGSSKKTVEKMAQELPCPNCISTTQSFKYMGQAVAQSDFQIQQARKQAANNARTELAAMVSATVKRVIEEFADQYVTNDAQEFKGKMNDLSRTVINQTLTGTPITCEAKEKSESGNMIIYSCVELTGENVLNAINTKVKENDKLRTDYEYEKFKKVFEEEMSKMEQE